MRLRRILPLMLVALLAAACAGRLPDKGRIEIGRDEPVTIGVISALSGPVANEGQGIANAVQLAAAQRGSVQGHSVSVKVVDGGCDPQRTEEAVQQLVQIPGLAGVIGPTCSAACVAAEPLLDERALVMLTPRCTDVSVTRQGYEGVVRISFTDAVEPAATAVLANDYLDASSVFVVHDGTLYGRGLRDVFRTVFGKENLAGNVEALPGTEDYGSVVRAIKKSSAGMVYYAGFAEDATRFVRQLRQAGVTLPVVLSDAVLTAPGFIQLAGTYAEGVYITQSVPQPGRGYTPFAEAYRRQFGTDPGPWTAEAYDAATILLDAVQRTADDHDGRLIIDRRRLRNALRDTDVQGASGPIRFRENGDRYEGVVVRVNRVRAGRLVEDRLIKLND